MMEEEPEKMVEAEEEKPKENIEKNMMTEEEMKKIADFVSENQKSEMKKIEERLEGIVGIITATKERTEVGLKDIDN
eukprot:978673-Heterocapsa_arctica.AAC.1